LYYSSLNVSPSIAKTDFAASLAPLTKIAQFLQVVGCHRPVVIPLDCVLTLETAGSWQIRGIKELIK